MQGNAEPVTAVSNFCPKCSISTGAKLSISTPATFGTGPVPVPSFLHLWKKCPGRFTGRSWYGPSAAFAFGVFMAELTLLPTTATIHAVKAAAYCLLCGVFTHLGGGQRSDSGHSSPQSGILGLGLAHVNLSGNDC